MKIRFEAALRILKFRKKIGPPQARKNWDFTMFFMFLLWFSAFLTRFSLSFWTPAAPKSQFFSKNLRISENRPKNLRSGYHPPTKAVIFVSLFLLRWKKLFKGHEEKILEIERFWVLMFLYFLFDSHPITQQCICITKQFLLSSI